MSVTRFGSQIKPIDATEKNGYVFFPAAGGILSNAAATAMVSTGMPAIQFTATGAGYASSPPFIVPHDLDSSATCYASLVWGSVTTATDATAIFTAGYNTFGSGSTLVAQTATAIAANTVTAAATVGYVTVGTSSAMATSPTPGNYISWKVSCDPLTADTVSVLGIKMQYTRRFV